MSMIRPTSPSCFFRIWKSFSEAYELESCEQVCIKDVWHTPKPAERGTPSLRNTVML